MDHQKCSNLSVVGSHANNSRTTQGFLKHHALKEVPPAPAAANVVGQE